MGVNCGIVYLNYVWQTIDQLMGRYHPDKNVNNPEASELFKEVAYSYGILSDPEKRRQFDNAGFEVLFFLPHLLNILGLEISDILIP